MLRKIIIRKAKKEDVPEIVRLLSEDPYATNTDRETYVQPIPDFYYQAFKEINKDKNNLLIVAKSEKKVVGTLQITFIPGISFNGGTRALIEAIMVDKNCRSQGVGSQMMRWAIEKAKEKNCRFVQLTSNKKRRKAHRFYERLGLVASHEGFKMELKK